MYFTEHIVKKFPYEIVNKIFSNITIYDVAIKGNFHALKWLLEKELSKNKNYRNDTQINILDYVITGIGSRTDKLSIVDLLINKYKFVYETISYNKIDKSIIYSLINTQDIVLVDSILNKYKISLDKTDVFGNNILHYNSSIRYTLHTIEILKYLITKCGMINNLNKHNENFLFYFIRCYSHLTISKYIESALNNFIMYMIDKGININQINIYNETLFIIANKYKWYSLSKILIDKCADIHIKDRFCNNPYMLIDILPSKNSDKYLRYIMKFYDLNERNVNDETILHHLAKYKYYKIIDYILDNKLCNPYTKSIYGDTFAHIIVRSKCKKSFNVLYKYLKDNSKYSINDLYSIRNNNGHTILHESLYMYNNYATVKLLNNKTVNYKNYLLENSLHIAVKTNNYVMIDEIFKYDIDKNAIDNDDNTPLDIIMNNNENYIYANTIIKITNILLKYNCITHNQ